MERRLTRDELHHLLDLSGGLLVVFSSSGEIGHLGMRSSITGCWNPASHSSPSPSRRQLAPRVRELLAT
jgi:hypothetical protein